MPSVNPNDRFRSEFVFDHLPSFLALELKCGSFEQSQTIEWFHREWKYFPPQKSQFEFNQLARQEIAHHVGRSVEPPKVVRDQPVSTGWTPCRHWGGSRQCDNCRRASHVAGVMARAEALWQENHRFVRSHINTVLTRRGQEVTPDVFDDLDSGVWHRVTKTIESFKDPGNGTQRRDWLKQAVEWTVTDYFRDTMAAKRDVRKETSFDKIAEEERL